MSVLGKKNDEWVALTLCDFGDPTRRHKIRNHFSMDAAINSFKDICKIYGKNSRCWQETREGVVFNENVLEKTSTKIG